MSKEDLQKCLKVGAAALIFSEVNKLRTAHEPPTKRRKLYQLQRENSKVAGFLTEGYHSENLFADRTKSIEEILKNAKKHKQILLQSPPFTGKTWLFQAIADYLSQSEHYNDYLIIPVSFILFDQTNIRLRDFWASKCDYPLSQLENLNTKKVILLDEFQVLFALNEKEVESTKDAQIIQNIVSENQYFMKLMKYWTWDDFTYVIGFAGYGSGRHRQSKAPTPHAITCKTSKYAKFTDEELESIYSDFLQRSQFNWMTTFPQSLKDTLKTNVDGHVGYISCILHSLADNHLRIPDETSLVQFFYSNEMYLRLFVQRPTPKWSHLSSTERNALKHLLLVEEDALNSNQAYYSLCRSGWCCWDDQRETVKFPCRLLKQLVLIAADQPLRPATDNFEKLVDFVDAFLEKIPSSLMVKTKSLCKNKTDTKLESFWKAEFYHIGHTLLRWDTHVSVEVYAHNHNKPKSYRRVDFYINGARNWAVEFLIEGEKKVRLQGKKVTSATEHNSRFREGGSYAPLKPKEWLVVDFRPFDDYSDLIPDTYLKNYWAVLYTDNKLRVIKYDEEGSKKETKDVVLFSSELYLEKSD
eukprot:TRINITY_DN1693_c0_g1_i5.p1 TRINITY_DN1693_c0_g1~~TRINITY_DN1693_c0_g1_i5.p1  ORF type:complete len:660 (+),score=89.00 TRINITY_DN1693_c0_g1_i5:234-1982(+)